MKSSLLVCLLVGLVAVSVASAADTKCTKAADFISNYTIGPLLEPVFKEAAGSNWTGVLFLPVNSALEALLETVLQAANLTALPEDFDLSSLAGSLEDVLLYHLLPKATKALLDITTVTKTTTLGPYKTELSMKKSSTGSFCKNATGEVRVRANVTSNTTVYVLDTAMPKDPAMVSGTKKVCEGTVMLIKRVLLPCATGPGLDGIIAKLKAAGNTTSPSTNGTTTRGLPSPATNGTSPSPSPPAPSSATAAVQSLVALLACSLALLSVFVGF